MIHAKDFTLAVSRNLMLKSKILSIIFLCIFILQLGGMIFLFTRDEMAVAIRDRAYIAIGPFIMLSAWPH